MKIKFAQKNYNSVELTLTAESLAVLLDHIGEDQIELIEIVIKKPEVTE